MRRLETDQIINGLITRQSLLILAPVGGGKTHLGQTISNELQTTGWRIAIATYNGAAKETLGAIAHQLNVPTTIPTDKGKEKQMTAAQIREELKHDLTRSQTLLVVDDAHRWSASLRYWLEDLLTAGAVLLVLASNPPTKDIFVKLPVVELSPLAPEQIRDVMAAEAQAQNLQLSPSDMATLLGRAGSNLSLARRVIHEESLGISETRTGDRVDYIDGTPILVTGLALIGVIRFIGLGLGDKVLYVMGGILTLGAFAFRSMLYAANRGKKKL